MERQAYRPEAEEAIAALEARRKKLGFSCDELCMKAGVSSSTWRRARASGRAKKGLLIAMGFALRSLEQRAKTESEAF